MKTGISVIVFFLILFLSQTLIYAQPNCVTKRGYLAALTEEALDRAITFSVQKDIAALQQLINSGLVFQLKAGVPVYRESGGFLSGKIKIRPAGSVSHLWTVMEAVDCQ